VDLMEALKASLAQRDRKPPKRAAEKPAEASREGRRGKRAKDGK
jgi:hypothetical protein